MFVNGRLNAINNYTGANEEGYTRLLSAPILTLLSGLGISQKFTVSSFINAIIQFAFCSFSVSSCTHCSEEGAVAQILN